MNRKDFLHKVTRYGIFILLIALFAGALAKRMRLEEELCDSSSECGACQKFSSCKLPKAQNQRNGK